LKKSELNWRNCKLIQEIYREKGWILEVRETDGILDQFAVWSNDEFIEHWYWSKYIGKKDKWRPPKNWKDKRKRLVSVGHEYWESYQYPKESWKGITDEEWEILLKKFNNKEFKILNKFMFKFKAEVAREGKVINKEIPLEISVVYYLPEIKMIVRRLRLNTFVEDQE